MHTQLVDTLFEIIWKSYVNGLLMYEPMSIAGLKVSMVMYALRSQVSFQYGAHITTINIYDNDTEELQMYSFKDALSSALKV